MGAAMWCTTCCARRGVTRHGIRGRAAKPLMRKLIESGGLIVDPFAGTSTWGEIAVSQGCGCRSIGCDVRQDGSTEVVV